MQYSAVEGFWLLRPSTVRPIDRMYGRIIGIDCDIGHGRQRNGI